MVVKAIAAELSSSSQVTVNESVDDEVAVTVSPPGENKSRIFHTPYTHVECKLKR